MSTYDPTAYGAAVADDYDRCYDDDFYDSSGAVPFLVELAGAGPVLELGVGTGRLALPLRQAGLAVHGIDASEAMLARLRAKPGGDGITVTVADFSDFEVDDRFSLAVLAVNTIFALPSQDAQVRCFRRAADHLAPGGRFVVEAFVPNPARFRDGESIGIRAMANGRVALDIARIDPANQFMHTTQVHLGDGTVSLHPANHRYAWPAELDLMARLASLGLEDRWEGWRHTPFTSASRRHISVYRKPTH
jgi:SAM-dependent methyltransferase